MAKSRTDVPVAERVGRCPHCGGDQLTPVADDRVLCVGCRRCWEVTGRVVRRVTPWRCSGCALQVLCREPVADHAPLTVLSAPVRCDARASRGRRHPAPALRPLPPPPPLLPPMA